MDWLAAIVKGALGATLAFLFPPKTAADQKVDDLNGTVKEANNAIQTSEKVNHEDLAAVQLNLDKRVRDPNS